MKLQLSRLKPPEPPLAAADPADEVAALAQQLEGARGRLALLDGNAADVLVTAPSSAELAAEREMAEWKRGALRDADRAELAEQLAAAEALRRASSTLRDVDIRDAIDARKALAAQRRAETPASTIAELHRHSRWTRIGCGVLIGFGMVWSAVNVQHNMAPGGVTTPVFWTSFLLESLISGLLVIIALGTAKVRDAGVEPSAGIRWAEFGLFLATFGLNTFPYLHKNTEGHIPWGQVVFHGIAPTMIGTTLLVLHLLTADYARARAAVAQRVGDITTVHLPALPGLPGAHTAQTALHTAQPDVPTAHPAAQPATAHRAPEPRTATVPGGNTAVTDRAPRTAREETEQSARTVQPATAHRAPEPRTAHPDASHGAHPARQEAHTSPQTAPVDVVVDAEGHTDQDSAPAHRGGEVPREAAQDTSDAESGQGTPLVVDHGVAVAEPSAPEVAPRTAREETEQSARTAQPATAHRAPEPGTAHRAVSHGAHPVHRAVRTAHPDARTAHQPAQPAHAEAAHRADNPDADTADPELWALAAEVHARLPRTSSTRFTPAHIAQALRAHRRDGWGPDRIYREKLGPHRDTTAKWFALAAQIEAEHGGGAQVIALRDRG